MLAIASALLVAAPLAARSTAIPAGNLVQNPGAEDSPGHGRCHRRQARGLGDDRQPLDLDLCPGGK